MTKAAIIARYGQAYYDAHLAKTRANAKAWYYANPERRASPEQNREKQKRWLENPENREKKRAQGRKREADKLAAMSPEEREAFYHAAWLREKARKEADPEFAAKRNAQRKAIHDGWRDKNRDYVNAASRAWAKSNQEYRQAIAVAMAARRRSGGKIDKIFVLWLRSQPCVDCAATDMIEVGHVVPVKLGGTNDPANLIPQCRSCNRRLSSRPHRLAHAARTGQKA